jgi:3-oxoacyl-[acyl-carrier protein] reductase
MTADLRGKVAIVTGASRPRGMGKAAAVALAQAGADVVVTGLGRRRSDLDMGHGYAVGTPMSEIDKVAEEISEMGVRSLAMAVDVSRPDEVQACVDRTVDELGGVDIVFNNAGTAIGVGPFEDIPVEHWDLGWQVNVMGTANMCRSVAPVMRERGGGSIINNSSISGLVAFAEMSAYTASKWAVIGLTKALAMDLGPSGIRCNVICPGDIVTDMGDVATEMAAEQFGISPEEVGEHLAANEIALRRRGDGSDVAGVVTWLAGDASAYVTGGVIPVTGGWAAGLA